MLGMLPEQHAGGYKCDNESNNDEFFHGRVMMPNGSAQAQPAAGVRPANRGFYRLLPGALGWAKIRALVQTHSQQQRNKDHRRSESFPPISPDRLHAESQKAAKEGQSQDIRFGHDRGIN